MAANISAMSEALLVLQMHSAYLHKNYAATQYAHTFLYVSAKKS